MLRQPPTSPLFPYTTLFRSSDRTMCRENPGWGAPRIHGELRKLGIDLGESSVSKYMVRCRKPPSQTWRTFLENHAQQRSEEHTSELQSLAYLVCRLLLEKKT